MWFSPSPAAAAAAAAAAQQQQQQQQQQEEAQEEAQQQQQQEAQQHAGELAMAQAKVGAMLSDVQAKEKLYAVAVQALHVVENQVVDANKQFEEQKVVHHAALTAESEKCTRLTARNLELELDCSRRAEDFFALETATRDKLAVATAEAKAAMAAAQEVAHVAISEQGTQLADEKATVAEALAECQHRLAIAETRATELQVNT